MVYKYSGSRVLAETDDKTLVKILSISVVTAVLGFIVGVIFEIVIPSVICMIIILRLRHQRSKKYDAVISLLTISPNNKDVESFIQRCRDIPFKNNVELNKRIRRLHHAVMTSTNVDKNKKIMFEKKLIFFGFLNTSEMIDIDNLVTEKNEVVKEEIAPLIEKVEPLKEVVVREPIIEIEEPIIEVEAPIEIIQPSAIELNPNQVKMNELLFHMEEDVSLEVLKTYVARLTEVLCEKCNLTFHVDKVVKLLEKIQFYSFIDMYDCMLLQEIYTMSNDQNYDENKLISYKLNLQKLHEKVYLKVS